MSEPLGNTQWQRLEDSNSPSPRSPNAAPVSKFRSEEDAEWLKYNILSLDGGGIRGFWTLLALQKLMEHIAAIEETNDTTYSSFWPLDLPRDVSQIPLKEEEINALNDAPDNEARARVLPANRRYLPCHYFDQFGGSSTGALIAIMLGRFRMTVPDCIKEYQDLSQKVFGHPRYFITLQIGMGNRYKYKAKRLEKVFKDVTARRNEKPNSETFGKITFPSREGLCTTFVTTKKSQHNGASATPYLIRSYHHTRQFSPNHSTFPTPRTTMGSSRVNTGNQNGTSRVNTATSMGLATQNQKKGKGRSINYEAAQEFEIWQVARAATAAPFYFEPLKVPRARTDGHILFTDGGFSLNNNPTKEGRREIEELKGRGSTGIVVSVGTARKMKQENGSKIKQWFNKVAREFRATAHELSDPEQIHDEMQHDHDTQGVHSWQYWRLNHADGLEINLDEWEPRHNWLGREGGSHTMASIEQKFNNWAGRTSVYREFDGCATALVECRRGRMFTDRWERFATGAHYRCHYRGCELKDFFNGNHFREHLKTIHDVPKDDIDWQVNTCNNQWRYQDGNIPNTK